MNEFCRVEHVETLAEGQALLNPFSFQRWLAHLIEIWIVLDSRGWTAGNIVHHEVLWLVFQTRI